MASGRGYSSGPLLRDGQNWWVSWQPEKNQASPVHPEGGRVYTPIDREAKTEIPAETGTFSNRCRLRMATFSSAVWCFRRLFQALSRRKTYLDQARLCD